MMYKDFEYYKPYLIRYLKGEDIKVLAEEAGCSVSNLYKLNKQHPELKDEFAIKPSKAERLYMDGAHGTFKSMYFAIWEHRMTEDQAWAQMNDIMEMVFKHLRLFDKRKKMEQEIMRNGLKP